MLKKNTPAVVKVLQAIPADAHGTGNVEGTVIDTLGFDWAHWIVNSGANGSSGTADVKIQEGDESDMSDAADITDAAFTQITEANDGQAFHGVVSLKTTDRKRYMWAYMAVGTAACDIGAVVVLGGPDTSENGVAPQFSK